MNPSTFLAIIGLLVPVGAVAADICESDTTAALERLLERQTRGWAFVVLDHEASGDFVQFGGEPGGIYVDLPVSPLSDDEAERAAALFAEAGIRKPGEKKATDPATGEEFMAVSYQLAFGADPARAARFGCRALREVYRIPPQAPVAIDEGP